VIDIQVEISASGAPQTANLPPEADRWVEAARAAVETTLADRGVDEAEMSLTLLDDEGIRSLNREHLDHDRPTDVLAFALYRDGEPVLGDVYLGWEQARRQANREGVPILEEVARLAVHGTLHVLGYDHPEAAESRAGSEMYRLQESILSGLDLHSPRPIPAGGPGGTGDSA
jgi:probable rRNA maturation factor